MKNLFSYLVCVMFFTACDKKDIAISPNVLIVMTDDQGYGDIGSHNNDSISTPHLDRFAREGIQFDRFYVSPVCAPTRASLLTGRYHLRTGTSWVTHRKEVMRSEEYIIAEALKDNGYRTGIFGKWHNGEQYPHHPNGQGFDEFYGFAAGHWNNYFDTRLQHNGVEVQSEGYITDDLTDKAIAFMSEEKDEPFFCYIPYNAPHGPFQVPEQYFQKYKNKGLNDNNACVYGMVENIDDNFNRILSALEQEGKRENTIIIFLTDNGPNGKRYNGGMRGTKGSVHEGGVRVPFFIQWPEKYNAPRIIKELASHIDIMPTILDLCGAEHRSDSNYDGRSLQSLLNNSETQWRERNIYSIQNNGSERDHPSSVRNNQYRLVKQSNSDIALYDMLADPSESKDLSEKLPDIRNTMLIALEEWFADVTKLGNNPPPIELGHVQSHKVHLPAHEGAISGNVQFQGRMGWANDWLKNWDDTGIVTWSIKVVESQEYNFSALYVANSNDPIIELVVDGISASQKIDSDIISDYLPSPDRIKRGEVYERRWNQLVIGSWNLEKGEYQVSLKVKGGQNHNEVLIKGIEISPK